MTILPDFALPAEPADQRENLIELLRAELEEYGGLLNLLEAQQNAILHRAPDTVLELNASISQQVKMLHDHREKREIFVREIAVTELQPSECSLRTLLRYFRTPVQPLLEALIDEINRIVWRVRQRAQQNQMLLARSVEVMTEIIQRLRPEAMTRVYGSDGHTLFGIRESGVRWIARG